VFTRNDDGSYYITSWYGAGRIPHERFLQVSNGGPVLAATKSKCHLYCDKRSDTSYVYVTDINHWASTYEMLSHSIAISDSDRRDPRFIVFDPPTANVADKVVCCSISEKLVSHLLFKMGIKILHDVSAGGVLWRISKVPPG
jgi:hypothetical protein